MITAPNAKTDWVKIYFIILTSISVFTALACGSYRNRQLSDDFATPLGKLVIVSAALLFASSIMLSFVRWRIAIAGFLAVALTFLIGLLFPHFRY